MEPEQIKTWLDYMTAIPPGTPADLKELGRYPGAILITGCQRSGTTILCDIIQSHENILSKHSELEGALVLRGYRPPLPRGRHCFQTTYVSAAVEEYTPHAGKFKMVFVLRNPLSVVYSMANNWSRATCNYVFHECGMQGLGIVHRWLYNIAARTSLNRTRELTVRRAIRIYNAKVNQIFRLAQIVPETDLIVVEYDQLVTKKDTLLPQIYDFLMLGYKKSYAELLHGRSTQKAAKFSPRRKRLINNACRHTYERALDFLSIG